jgi:hypothetical protein
MTLTPDSVACLPPQTVGPCSRALHLSGDEPSADDVALVRRQARLRLLRDLVSNGLYRVPTEALAERLVGVVTG